MWLQVREKWIKKANATNSEEDFISTYGGGAYGWIFDLNNTSNIRFYNGTWAASSITISDTNWHYVSVTFNHSTYKVDFYVDGQSIMNGTMDEVAIYNRALSAAEVLSVYNGQK